MSSLSEWSAEQLADYTRYLRTRAQLARLDPRLTVRSDEDDLVNETLRRAAQGPACEGTTMPQHLAWLRTIFSRVVADLVASAGPELDAQAVVREQSDGWEASVAARGRSPGSEVAWS